MKYLPLLFVVLAALPCSAQAPCAPAQLRGAATRVHSIEESLKKVSVAPLDAHVPTAARDLITKLKDALTCAADAELAGAGPMIDTVRMQETLARVLDANAPEPTTDALIEKSEHLFDEAPGNYGHDVRVQVAPSSTAAKIVQVEFSINIPCSEDHILLVYTRRSGVWRRELRWQAPPLKQISDAFGDFFLVAALPRGEAGDAGLRVVVAHGTPWCTSRFSVFKVDVLSPTPDPNSPKVLWHTSRGYSRGGADPLLRASGNTFELRLNRSTMDIDSFERPVIYRYLLDEHDGVRRIQPIAANARGFVEEWLSMPWAEAMGFTVREAGATLHEVHDHFDAPLDPSSDEFTAHSYGPVRACKAPREWQVQIDSTIERSVPGKPGGDSRPLPARYFHVREEGNGYVMLSAPTQPDPTCTGPDLMSGPHR